MTQEHASYCASEMETAATCDCGIGETCEHDIVVLCFKEGWFCLDCRKIVDHDCSYKETRYRYGITGFRVSSEIAKKVRGSLLGEK